MENNIRITKTKDNRYYISLKKYRFFLFPYWVKITSINEKTNKEEIMFFDNKEEAKSFLDYIYII